MRFLTLIFFFAITGSTDADLPSPFNGLRFSVDTTGNYSFVVGGHFYGKGSTNSGFPASTVLGGLERIRSFGPNALFITGDLFLNVELDSANYSRVLFDVLPFPVYNAVGNHDLDGDHYSHFEPTFFSFQVGDDHFMVLDTEMDNGSIEGEQFDMFKSMIEAANQANAGNLFVFSHRPVYVHGEPEFDHLLKNNTRSLTGNNFRTDLLPLIAGLEGVDVYWFSGSMGGGSPSSFLYHEGYGMTSILTAIRDTRKDAVLGVTVEHGAVSFTTIPLGINKTKPVDYYDLKFWQKNLGKDEGFNYRLIPYYIRSTITHRAYWIGVLSLLMVILIWKYFSGKS